MYKSSLHPLYNNFQNAKHWNIFELLFHGIKMIKITCYTLFQDLSLELSLFQIKKNIKLTNVVLVMKWVWVGGWLLLPA